MTGRGGLIWMSVAGGAVLGLCLGLSLAVQWYGPVVIHAARTGEFDMSIRPDLPAPRFARLAEATGCQPWQVLPSGRCSVRTRVAVCNATLCDITYDRGWVVAIDHPAGDAAAQPPFTGHFSQRLGYRISNGDDIYEVNVAVAYRPSPGEDRLGDDVDTTEAWEHLDTGINFFPVTDRMQWAIDGRDARLLVTAYDGARIAVNIRQPVADDGVECSQGVVLFGPLVRRTALIGALNRCLAARTG